MYSTIKDYYIGWENIFKGAYEKRGVDVSYLQCF